MTRQVAQLDQARSLGLSQSVIDQLKLFDPGNAQQLDRLMNDILNNPGFIAQLNAASGTRQGVATGLNAESVDSRRTQEDFAQSLRDQEEDYRTSIERSKRDFAQALADRQDDFDKSLARSSEDYRTALARNSADFEKAQARAKTSHDNAMADMASDFAMQLEYAQKDYTTAAQRMAEDFDTQTRRSQETFALSLSDMASDLDKMRRRAIEDMADFGYEITGGPNGVVTAFSAAATDLGTRIAGLPAQLRPTLSANIAALAGDLRTQITAALAGVTDLIPTSLPGPGFSGKGGLGKIGYSTGGLVEGTGTGTSDSVHIRVSRGEYIINAEKTRQWGVDRLDMLNAGLNPWDRTSTSARPGRAAQTRIREEDPARLIRRATAPAQRDTLPTVTLQPMPRPGLGADQVRAARMQPYSVPVVNTSTSYSYDQSVNVANVELHADNPQQMAEQLRRKVAFARLVQPERADRVVI